MDTALLLVYEFFKTGLLALGGGLATIPFLMDMSDKYGWFSHKDLTTMLAVSESTPGAIGINMATYTGFVTYGILGGIITTLSLVAPSIIIITVIAGTVNRFRDSLIMVWVFDAIRPAVVAFVTNACIPIFFITMFKADELKSGHFTLNLMSSFNSYNYINITLFFAILWFYHRFKLHPIVIVMLCGILGIILKLQ